MKFKFLMLCLFMIICACKTEPIKIRERVEVVDPDYGILSAADKLRDGSIPLEWRCFPVKDVQIKYRTWPDTDPMNSRRVIEIMCDFEIFVEDKSVSNHYGGRRGKPESYCNNFKAAWKKLTQGEEHVCIDGESRNQFKPEEDNAEFRMSWTWDKIKTKKGCYSFWNEYGC